MPNGSQKKLLPIFPYVLKRVPDWVYRIDSRGPEEIFKDGFTGWDTYYDIPGHLADWKHFSKKSGFVSVARDIDTAMKMFVRWELGPLLKEMRETDLNAGLAVQELVKKGYGNETEFSRLRRIARELAEDRDGTYLKKWLYVIKPSRYLVSMEGNVLDPGRIRHSGGRARKLVKEATEWDAPWHIPPQRILQAYQVDITLRFTFSERPDGRLPVKQHAWSSATDFIKHERDRRKGFPGFDKDFRYNPFEDEAARWTGLVGYWTKLDEAPWTPGSGKFTAPRGWRGEKEFWPDQGQASPGHPFGTPAEVTPIVPQWAR
ncbi:hypothetical protein V7793_06615 [Streptomyces sp. KLMMK]|uniref:scabin-related ADP-ribosyltransferase n=1 Tax=Streptomyces sp. KLMMK TaxID=3109353 RepID=UPI002FFF0040